MRSTKKFLLVALVIVAAVAMFAFAGSAKATNDVSSSVDSVTVAVCTTGTTTPVTSALIPNGTTVWDVVVSNVKDAVGTIDADGTNAQTIEFDVYLGTSTTNVIKIATAQGTQAANGTTGVFTITAPKLDISPSGVVYKDGTYIVYVCKTGVAPATGFWGSATIEVGKPAATAITSILNTPYTPGSANLPTVTYTSPVGGTLSVLSQDVSVWYSGSRESSWSLSGTPGAFTLSLPGNVTVNSGTRVARLSVEYAALSITGTGTTSNTSVFTESTSNFIVNSVTNPILVNITGTTVNPMGTNEISIVVTNNTTAQYKAEVRLCRDNYVNSDKVAILGTVDLAAGKKDIIKFDGMIDGAVVAAGNYSIVLDQKTPSSPVGISFNPSAAFTVGTLAAPINSSNVKFSPSPYVPGGDKMTVTVTPDSKFNINQTKVTSVDDVYGDQESGWESTFTDPKKANVCLVENNGASSGTKTAHITLQYDLLTLSNASNVATSTKKDAEITVNANFKVDKAVANVSFAKAEIDDDGNLVWELSANTDNIVTIIDLIPLGGSQEDSVMRWTWTSKTSENKKITWDLVVSAYPTRVVVEPGVYDLVAAGYTQSISGAAIVNTDIKGDKKTLRIGKVVDPTGIEFKPNTITIGKGLSYDASKILVFAPADTSTQVTDKRGITYKTDKSSIATVDENGVVTAKAIGEATITATCTRVYPNLTATLKVTVAEPSTKIELAPAQIRGLKDAKVEIKATFDGPEYPLTFTSSDEKIATVDKDGVVTILDESVLKDGVVIKVTCADLKFEQEIPVIGAVKATGLLVLPAGKEVNCPIGAIEKPKKVAGYITPANAVENVPGAVTYKSSDESIVFVKADGTMIGLSNGVAIITIEGAGFTDTVTVTVGAGAAEAPAAE